MKDVYSKKNQRKKVEELHYELVAWKSNLHFIQDEILFIGRLLNSYVFEPTTQNLFERLQDYQERLKSIGKRKSELETRAASHENSLGGMMECTDEYCDLQYYQKHDALKAQVAEYIVNFRELKWEIFSYAGGILKKRKPQPKA